MDIYCIFIYYLCMFKLKLYRFRNKLLFSVSILSKIPYLILIGVFIWGFFFETGNISVLAVILAFICLLGCFYTEHWTFDSKKEEICSYFGVFPIIKKHHYPFSSIGSIEIRHFIRGMLSEDEEKMKREMEDHASDNKKRRRGQKPMIVLGLNLTENGRFIPIEIIEESKSGGRTENEAVTISTYCKLHLIVDRPIDKGPTISVKDLPRGFNKR